MKNKTALQAFLRHLNSIEDSIKRIDGAAKDHFFTNPDDLNWGDVGSVEHYAHELKLICDQIFNEGEHAPENN